MFIPMGPMNMSPQMLQQLHLMQQHAAQAQAGGRVGGYPMHAWQQLQMSMNGMNGIPFRQGGGQPHANLTAAQAAPVKVAQQAHAQARSQGAVTIGKLSDEVLLNIFRYYLDVFHDFGPGLCIYVANGDKSYLRLNRLYVFDCSYGGSTALDPPPPEDEDNIMAALKQSGRIIFISLTVSRRFGEMFLAIKGLFSELEDLVLLSQDGVLPLTLPSTFRWGPRLRRLHLTRITFPELPQLLCPSRNLVDLQLHGVFNALRLSPEVLRGALSGMTQLRALSLHFLPIASFVCVTSPSRERVVLPALTRLNYRGMSQYSEGLVVGMYAPRLRDVEITFFDEFLFSVPKLRELIGQMKMQRPCIRADILFSGNYSLVTLSPSRLHNLGSPGALN
ncbi:hypothetical protein EDB92DRAFT_1939932 [Lactarius akahatsu]|uniref:Uncharacterized protein n=1 Tax=Lactarius akahatsu TaxID=416441 RepID=A0AAD4LTL9_9AGAM|nr:hypothetical protein EDB92DRAFT_1939932 [Lactarius akahatsu]